ncbi:hypothetical protein GCM10010483_21220 [Actinokineospora diospyrosa]
MASPWRGIATIGPLHTVHSPSGPHRPDGRPTENPMRAKRSLFAALLAAVALVVGAVIAAPASAGTDPGMTHNSTPGMTHN